MQSDLVTRVGVQNAGAEGVIVGGPKRSGIENWWQVDFDQNADGWAKGNVLVVISTTPTPTPTVSLQASRTSILVGESTQLTWSSQNATSCTAQGGTGFSGSVALSGSASVSPSATTTYSLSCQSASSSPVTTSVTITVSATTPNPTASLQSSKTSILRGESAQLTWSSQNATSCTAQGGTGFSGSVALSGSATVSPTATTTYSLTCARAGAPNAVATVTINVTVSGSTSAQAFSDPDNGQIPDRTIHPLAFPSAMGFGKVASVRAANAVVYKINSLLDVANPNDGLITYRECALALAVNTPYVIPAGRPRYCVFDVAGAIVIDSPAFITIPKIYIAGQSSPGGVEFKLGPNYSPVDSLIDTRNGGDHMILRHVRARTGSHLGRSSQNGDPIRMSGTQFQILDHVTTQFGTDESLDMSCKNCTVQWSMVGPNFCRDGGHVSSLHCKSFFLKPAVNVTVSHNLIQHGEQRGINIAVGVNPPAATNSGQADIVNNVLYNFTAEQGLVSNQFGDVYANYIGNASFRGPRFSMSDGNYLIGIYNNGARFPFGFDIFASDNVSPQRRIAGQFGSTASDPDALVAGFISHVVASTVCGLSASGDQDCSKSGLGVVQNMRPAVAPGNAGLSVEADQITGPEQSMRDVLSYAGADLCRDGSCRDNVDQMYLEDVRSCDSAPYLFPSNWPTTQAEYGIRNPPVVGAAKVDSDNDGMPDEWERRFVTTNPNIWDANNDMDGDGYPNIEEYLNELAQEHVRYSGFIGSGTGRVPAYNCGRAMAPAP